MNQSLIPAPGTDLVPDGWADDYVWPWLQARMDTESFQQDAARLASIEAAYKLIDADTLEVVKARRYLEVRWGELLPKDVGGRGKPSQASEGLDKDDRHRFRQLAEGGDRVVEAIRQAMDSDQISRAALLRTATGAHVGRSTGEYEWYTPDVYVEAARAVMGGIDLDPASSEVANEVVGAARFYSVDDDGLKLEWRGRVWMNPPYSQPAIQQFVERLRVFYEQGYVSEACVLTNNATETAWGQLLLNGAAAVCFPSTRVKFWGPGKESASPLQGQMVAYWGSNPVRFQEKFSQFGVVR